MKKYLLITAMFVVFFGVLSANTSKAANSPFASLLKKPISGTISKTIKPISGTIRGMVRDVTGKPVMSVTITVYRKVADKFEFYARTESDFGPRGGKYEVKIDKQGVYRVIPSYTTIKPGVFTFNPKQETVKVMNAKPITVDFRMRTSK